MLTRGEQRSILRAAKQLLQRLDTLVARRGAAEATVRDAYRLCLANEVERTIALADTDALEPYLESARGLSLLRDAGWVTIGQIRAASRAQLEAVSGVGPAISGAVQDAAEHFVQAAQINARIRLDAEVRRTDHEHLVAGLAELRARREAILAIVPPADQLAGTLRPDLDAARRGRGWRGLFAGPDARDQAHAALLRLQDLVAAHSDVATRRPNMSDDPWAEFERHTAEINGLLAEVVGLPDTDAARGHLSEELIERINDVDLDTDLLRCTLRGYQAFGAKFALAQVRGILGDEMGLGKTVQALALLCHLRSEGYRHFLVVSPTSVLANWEHEIRRHTELEPVIRLHGPEREDAFARWSAHGGVALTTFGTLPRLGDPPIDVAAVVVDEAHYVKNPDAKRTQAVERWLSAPSYALLLTGTPMENRPGEFRSLVELVRPDVAYRLPDPEGPNGAAVFRQAVAPAYLRRNQEDVLTELPERIETEEWLTLEGPELEVYRQAVAERNFMAMRQAAFLTEDPLQSSKLNRIIELVHEAGANGRKVVIFSYFREVIDRVEAALGPWAMGQITGSVSPRKRQEIVDRFSSSYEPGALVCQIEAAGVGMNMQAASVVILTEPQWKPSTEEQAIARCHRMGQARRVEVHRLLTEHAVDEYMREILERKGDLFDRFVRRSNLKDAAPEAIDARFGEADQASEPGGSRAAAEDLIITREMERLDSTPGA